MAGFGLNGFEGRVPCPFCQSTDCCGMRGDDYVCGNTGNVVTDAQLEASAHSHRLTVYEQAAEFGLFVVNKRTANVRRGTPRFFVQHPEEGYLGDGATIAAAYTAAAAVLAARSKHDAARSLRGRAEACRVLERARGHVQLSILNRLVAEGGEADLGLHGSDSTTTFNALWSLEERGVIARVREGGPTIYGRWRLAAAAV